MLIIIFFFTLLIAFIVYKLISREQYVIKERPSWQKLAYWIIVMFISMIFIIVIYTENSFTFRISNNFSREGLELFITIATCCLLIQLMSPWLFLPKMKRNIQATLGKEKPEELSDNKVVINRKPQDKEQFYTVKNDYLIDEQNTGLYDSFKRSQEKDFEYFLNTLCWLTFSFAIFISLFFTILSLLKGMPNIDLWLKESLPEYSNVKEVLSSISCIFLVITLSISIRQVIFYLIKLKKGTGVSECKSDSKSLKYKRYMLVQKNLNKTNDKL